MVSAPTRSAPIASHGVIGRDSRTHAPNELLEFDKPRGNATLRIALPCRVALPIRVIDEVGEPVAGSRLELVRSLDASRVTLQSECIDHFELCTAGQTASPLLLDTGNTDASGRATLRWHPQDNALVLRVLGPGHVPQLYSPIAIGSHQPTVVVTVSRGVTLRGKVAPLEV